MALIYKCEICGKSYNTIKERNECEMKCIAASEKAAEDKRRKEEEIRKAEIEKKKVAAEKEINESITKTINDIVAFEKKYGSYPNIKLHIDNEDIDFGPILNRSINRNNLIDKIFDHMWWF